MTREESYKEVTKLRPMYHDEIIQLLDEVYDDIESRICENCKYAKLDSKGNLRCYNDVDYESMPYEDQAIFLHTYKDFGCNKFKRKLESK